MAALHHHADALGIDLFHDRVSDLLGEALLDLQSARKAIHDACDLAHADHLVLGDVAHMAASEEGQHVVFAQAVDLDVAHNDHVVRMRLEDRAVHDLFRRLPIAAGQEGERFRHALGSPLQPFAVRIFAQLNQELTRQLCHSCLINLFFHTVQVKSNSS